jgi:hypothetical protein
MLSHGGISVGWLAGWPLATWHITQTFAFCTVTLRLEGCWLLAPAFWNNVQAIKARVGSQEVSAPDFHNLQGSSGRGQIRPVRRGALNS